MRLSGVAFGLALAVRPAGAVEAPGSTARRRRVPRSGMRSTVEAGGADPDNARRSGPLTVTFSGDGVTRARVTAWSSRPGAVPGRYGGHRTRPVTGAAGRGSSARRRASARRARRKLPHRQRRAPALDPSRLRRATLGRSSLPGCRARSSRFTSRPSGLARRRCALEPVEKSCHNLEKSIE